jgi:hypothetical protein
MDDGYYWASWRHPLMTDITSNFIVQVTTEGDGQFVMVIGIDDEFLLNSFNFLSGPLQP